jgi:hypothetical protein
MYRCLIDLDQSCHEGEGAIFQDLGMSAHLELLPCRVRVMTDLRSRLMVTLNEGHDYLRYLQAWSQVICHPLDTTTPTYACLKCLASVREDGGQIDVALPQGPDQ